MRSLIIGAAALLAVAAPSIASAQTGYVGASWATVDVDGAADSQEAIGVDGAIAFEGSSSISFEIDAAYVDSDNADSVYGLTAHAFTRNDDYLLGVFVGVADGDNSTVLTGGVEANKYYADWTLAGAVAVASDDDNDVDAWGVSGQARYFVHDNLKLQGNLGWVDVDTGLGDDSAVTVGAEVEYQLATTPISFRAAYNHAELDEADLGADAFLLGVRYNWGGTLRDRDRRGASQADISSIGGVIGL